MLFIPDNAVYGGEESLTDSLVRLRAGRNQSNNGDNGKKRDGGKPRTKSNTRKIKNDVSRLTAQDFKDKLHKNYFEYQMA